MGRLPLCSKLIKQRKSQLLIRVRKAESYDTPPACTSHSNSSNKIHLTFIKHIKKRYVDSSNSSSLLGEVVKRTNDITLCCQDPRIFEKFSHTYSSISQVLESFNIKKGLHHKFIAQVIMRCGRKIMNKQNKKKDFKGLVVILTTVHTFLGDQVSIHRAMEECDPAKAELNDDEYLLVTSEIAV